MTHIAVHSLKRNSILCIGALCMLTMLLYVLLLQYSVLSVVARREALSRAEQLEASLAALERDYLMQTSAITATRIAALGFNDATQVTHYARVAAPALLARAHGSAL